MSAKKLGPVVEAICGKKLKPREATYLAFRALDGQPIDHGLAIFFESPNSFTGEDVLELQAHGGDIVLQMLVKRCLEVAAEEDKKTLKPNLARLRIAKPGEFSERAFLNNKIDLAQAEAIADLIDASTEVAAMSASRSLSGEFSNEILNLKIGLIELRKLVEATLDFPEEDIDFLEKADAEGQLHRLIEKLEKVQKHSKQGRLLREGIKVVIAGQPNAGKSSLLNALAEEDVAIVTPVEGTTRDKIQQTIQIEGVPLHIIDTAGLREGEDEVEKIGVERTWAEIKKADVVLFLHDLSRYDQIEYQKEEIEIAAGLANIVQKNVPVLDVWNKLDTKRPDQINKGICISAKTGEGLNLLKYEMLGLAGWQSIPEGIYMTRERHMVALTGVMEKLQNALVKLCSTIPQLELMAEDLRLGQNILNEITGEFTNDDLLGEIFSKFCIGK